MDPVNSSQLIENNFLNSNKTPFEAFLNTLSEKLDRKIGEEVFQDLWEVMLENIQVTGWKEEGENQYRLTLEEEPVVAAREDDKEKTWYFEKEILMQFNPDNNEIIFPRVLELKKQIENAQASFEPSDKNLNAIWAWESPNIFMIPAGTYTGVGYSLKWDTEKQMFISRNINDAPLNLGKTREKYMDEALEEWKTRSRELLSDYNARRSK